LAQKSHTVLFVNGNKLRFVKVISVFLAFTLALSACASAAIPTASLTLAAASSDTITPSLPSETPLPLVTFTLEPSLTPSETPTVLPSETPTLVPTATSTQTLSEQLKTHIIFYLLIPEGKRQDACGDIKEVPIISKRMRTGDKLQDVQIALNMLFSVGRKLYGPYYNALWNTRFTIESFDYNARNDYMTITFGGTFPFTTLSDCDKHGIRQQIWTTFFHYGFKEKTFKYYDHFLIDRLGGN